MKHPNFRFNILQGPKEKLDSTVVAQTALFVSSMAALEKLKAEKPEEYDSGNTYLDPQKLTP